MAPSRSNRPQGNDPNPTGPSQFADHRGDADPPATAFGYGVRFDIKRIPVCVYDREGSQQSQDLLKHFQASEYFSVMQSVAGYSALVQAIDAGQCRLAIVIPQDYSQRLSAGGPVSVQGLLDAADNNTANVSISYGEAVVEAYNRQVQLDWLSRHGQSSLQPSLSVDARTWFNEDLESMANIVPGVKRLDVHSVRMQTIMKNAIE